jgi:hypothetical protein
MDIFDNFFSPRVCLRCFPFRNANLVGRNNAAYTRDPRELQGAAVFVRESGEYELRHFPVESVDFLGSRVAQQNR